MSPVSRHHSVLRGPCIGGGHHRARGGQLRRVPRVQGGGELGGGGGLHQGGHVGDV